MSTTMQTPGIGTARPEHRHLTTVLWVIVGLLAAALVALGAWVIADQYTGPESDATALVDDLAAAWSSYDADAVTAMYAPDAVLTYSDGTSFARAGIIGSRAPALEGMRVKVERVAPVTVEGDLIATFVRFSMLNGASERTWLTVLQTKDGKIVRHWDFDAGLTAPLDNAVLTEAQIP